MLVLSRKMGERLVIGDGIVVTVVAVRGRQVRLGIEAPASVRVRRAELPEADGGRTEHGMREEAHWAPVTAGARSGRSRKLSRGPLLEPAGSAAGG
jgi:carbon storage regulator